MNFLVGAIRSFLAGIRGSFWGKVSGTAKEERAKKGMRWRRSHLVGNCVLAKLAGMKSLRAVEMLTEVAAAGDVGTVGGRRMPDGTTYDWLVRGDPESSYRQIVAMAGSLHARKMLEPVRTVEIGKQPARILSFDGKSSFKEDGPSDSPIRSPMSYIAQVKDAEGTLHPEKREYTNVQIVRCVDASAAGPVAIGQLVVTAGDEAGAVRDLDRRLVNDCRWLRHGVVVKTGDARQGNQEFARQQGDPYREIDAYKDVKGDGPREVLPGAGHFYALKIKANAGHIYREGLRAGTALINSGAQPEAVDAWHCDGHGRNVMRELFRVDTTVGLGIKPNEECRLDRDDVAVIDHKDWPTVRQIVVVRQTIRRNSPPADGSPQVTSELRLLITNIKRHDCSAADLLFLLRSEWQVEVHHNVLDLVMFEDAGIWANAQNAPVAMATINTMAANLIILLKHRHLRSAGNRENLSYPQLAFVVLGVLAGSGTFKVLCSQAKAEFAQKFQAELDESEIPEEFTRQWSDAEVAMLVQAMRALFGFIGKHLAGVARRISLTMVLDLDTGKLTTELVTL